MYCIYSIFIVIFPNPPTSISHPKPKSPSTSCHFRPPHFCLGLRFVAISQDLPPDLFAALLELFVVSWAPKSARLAPQVLQATTPCAAVLHTAAQLLEVAVNPRLTCWVTWNQWGSLVIGRLVVVFLEVIKHPYIGSKTWECFIYMNGWLFMACMDVYGVIIPLYLYIYCISYLSLSYMYALEVQTL